jgi:hypothetical protein
LKGKTGKNQFHLDWVYRAGFLKLKIKKPERTSVKQKFEKKIILTTSITVIAT